MHTNQLKVIGCGGHCKVVLDALSLVNHQLKVSLCDSDVGRIGKEFSGILIDSTPESLMNFKGFSHVAIGDNKIRKKIINLMNKETLLFSIIHPDSIVSRSAFIGEGTLVAARSILGPDSYLGKACIINHGAVVDHDVQVGDYCHIAPNSTLGGRVSIGNNVLIGAGAVVLPGIKIGDGAIVGAGAVVVRDVMSNTIVKGIPAIVSKE